MRGQGTKHGEPLRRVVVERFRAWVPVDRVWRTSKSSPAVPLAVVVPVARTDRIEERRPRSPQAIESLADLRGGRVLPVGTRRRDQSTSRRSNTVSPSRSNRSQSSATPVETPSPRLYIPSVAASGVATTYNPN